MCVVFGEGAQTKCVRIRGPTGERRRACVGHFTCSVVIKNRRRHQLDNIYMYIYLQYDRIDLENVPQANRYVLFHSCMDGRMRAHT